MTKFKHNVKKWKHNKKRNTAIIYNILVNEFIEGSVNKRNSAEASLKLIKEHFGSSSILKTELHLYNDLLKAYGNDDFGEVQLVERLVECVRKEHDSLDSSKINESKSKLISIMNKTFGKDIWSRYSVPNYKNMATIFQILENSIGQSDRVLLEKKYVDDVVSNKDVQSVVLMEDVELVSRLAQKEFKEEYSGKLLEEQNVTLNKYINSYRDNGIDYKLHIDSELGRIKKALYEYLYNEKALNDVDLRILIKEALKKVNSFKTSDDEELILETVLKCQQLLKEIK